jgi:glycosyltransferase involved in cell wall biosynthesis
LRQRAVEHVRRQYSWDAVTGAYEDLLRRIARARVR